MPSMVNNHVSFKKLPWRKLTKALEREWAAMDEANKEAFANHSTEVIDRRL
jgi:hypothetical protein